jgi:hypothetical protein
MSLRSLLLTRSIASNLFKRNAVFDSRRLFAAASVQQQACWKCKQPTKNLFFCSQSKCGAIQKPPTASSSSIDHFSLFEM